MSRPATAAVRLLSGEREPVRVATTGNIDLYGLETIDSVALAVADRVLVKDQSDARENGIYTVSTGRWYRASDANHSRAITEGVTVHVQEGSTHGGQAFRFATEMPNIGDDAIQIGFYLSASFSTDAETIINALIAKYGAFTSAQIARLEGILAGLGDLTGFEFSEYPSLVTAELADIPDAKTWVATKGYYAAGDGGEALYKKVESEPAHGGKFQSADGAWWEIADRQIATLQTGAAGDDTADDAPATQVAVDVETGEVRLPKKTYRMVPGSVSPFTLGNTASNVYRAVALTQSDLTISGPGTVHGVSRVGAITADVQPVFSTDKNMTVGAVTNITFDGLVFESENDADAVNSNQRFAYMVGVDGLRFIDTIGHSSGVRRGYYSHIQNSRNIQVNGHRHDNMTGGFNLRYVDDFILTNFIFDNFSEAIDLDGTQNRAVIRCGSFKATGRDDQCIDVNSHIDASIGDFSVDNVGNIITVNYKPTTPPTYADYVNNVSPSTLSVSKRIVISNITGSAVGSLTQPCFYIGWDWAAGSHAGYGPVRDITVENIDLQDTGFFYVREGTNLRLNNITLRDVLVTSGFAAVDMRSASANADQLAWSDLDVHIRQMRVEGSQRGALKISTASRVIIEGFIAKGNNTLGGSDPALLINSMQVRGTKASIDGLDVQGNVILNGDSAAGGAVPYSVIWGAKNKVGGTLTLQGDVHKHIVGETKTLAVGDIPATGTVKRSIFIAQRKCYVARASYCLSAAVAASGSDYRTLSIKSIQSGGAAVQIAQINTIAGLAADREIDGGFDVAEVGAYLNKGDVIYFETAATAGAGRALSGLCVSLEVLGL